MEEQDERNLPEAGECSFLGKQTVGEKPTYTESKEDRELGQNRHRASNSSCQAFSWFV